ncbi:phosphatase PAP2 family protein [Pseudonocardia sp. HH130630-07]|uniref:phosphatase PAP2 family protein n=1 Tax=Pseudonocardia sp. HH130630-07 TaxID=1690815 RepID=UPI0009F387A2|nr:phosphatase PAP2 family protein [Pseudonocardia sp. HH130630-07]
MRSPTLWPGLAAMIAATLLGTAIGTGYTDPPAVDRWWNELLAADRADWMLSLALALDHIGGGWVAVLVVPVLMVLSLLLAGRRPGAVYAAVALAVSAGAVQLFKHLYGRARPEDMLVASDFGSFPSGHVANAATIATVLFVLFPRAWVAIAGAVWTVAMAFSRTLLAVHWATDTVGGVLVGAGAALLLAAVLLPRVRTTDPADAVPAAHGEDGAP